MKMEINLDALTVNSVTVITIKIIEDGGETYRMAPHAKAYTNCESGRAELLTEVPEPYLSAILAVWDDVPTVSPEE